MKQGFSLSVSHGEVQIQAHFEEDSYDSFSVKSSDVEMVLEGVILNKKNLLTQNGSSDFQSFCVNDYLHNGWRFLLKLEGEFRGCIWDKRKNRVLVFTNPTSTQRVFYTPINSTVLADTDLVKLSHTVKQNGFSVSPDITSLYQLLAIGNLLENRTPVNNIYKISDGSFLDIDCRTGNITETEYFNVSDADYYNKPKKKAIDDIHEVFTESVKMEYEKDSELGSSHLALLSGGLDSRMALMYALKNHFHVGSTLCFSQSGYSDETISRKIAADFGLNYEFIPLDQGIFLTEIDQLTTISEGTGLFTGGIHVNYALEQMKYQNFSLFHSGQIGDGILGGFNSEPNRKKPSDYKIIVNRKFLPQIESDLHQVFKKYEREEIFLLKNLAYNRTVLGAQVLQQQAYQVSPFMTKDFIKLSLSLPEEWKYKHQFYLQWLLEHCGEAAKYTWERTLMKPDAQWKIKFGEKYMKGGRNFLYKKLLHQPEKTSMYPYQHYYDSDIRIQKYYQAYFKENIDRLQDYKELRNDVVRLFSSEAFYHKSQAINILSIFKLYF